MSTKLALSSALSILLMAGFTLFGEQVAQGAHSTDMLFGAPAQSLTMRLPVLPHLPGLR
jgi:glutamine synthetase type III